MKELKFGCTGCGECCRRAGFVFFLESDQEKAAEFLGMSVETFRERFLELLDGDWILNVPEWSACPFLLDDACTIHPARPKQCATYPFWPEIIHRKGGWVRERKECPGIDRGRAFTQEEIEALMRGNGEA